MSVRSQKIATLKLSGSVGPTVFEKQLEKVYSEGVPVELKVDMSLTTWIDVAALMNLSSLLLSRKNNGIQTRLVLPNSKAVLDFLKVWRYAESIEAAIGYEFRSLLSVGDRIRWREPQLTYRGVGSGLETLLYDPDWNELSSTKRNFFEFTTFRSSNGESIGPNGPNAELPRLESRRWASPLIKQVLEKHLPNKLPCDEVARVVIYEALSNSVRHPGATFLQCCSRFHYPKPSSAVKGSRSAEIAKSKHPRKKGALQICVWDNGNTIFNTLLEVVNQNKSIRTIRLPEYMCDKIRIEYETSDGTKVGKPRVVSQADDLPSQGPKASEALLSSFFPGISRTASNPVPKVMPFDTSVPTPAASSIGIPSAGMGLYALKRTALDQFQGSIVARCGDLRLVLEMAHDAWRVEFQTRYKGKLTQYPNHFPRFQGNLLVINLPLRDAI